MAHKTIALVGNPNVGKSTVFNALTGMKQHTGNWPGKTVAVASGTFKIKDNAYTLVDLPGTYSLAARSAEEEITRDYVCFAKPDIVIAVCDGTCLERSLILALQLTTVCKRLILCVNLLDEAKRKGISIDIPLLEKSIGVPVVGISAKSKKSLKKLVERLDVELNKNNTATPNAVRLPEEITKAVSNVSRHLNSKQLHGAQKNFIALALLQNDIDILSRLKLDDKAKAAANKAKKSLAALGIDEETVKSTASAAVVSAAEEMAKLTVKTNGKNKDLRDQRLDKILTSKLFGFPIMILLLVLIFWISISGANYPSMLLSKLFERGGLWLTKLFDICNAPQLLKNVVVDGMYKILSWVIAVMLPPMAIFFPLFTLLEDFGYLPRVAYNLDRPFAKCKACGKQALTMCMGFGCNAVGVTGCRIIDSPRERLLAMLTNSFVPCNGRFPAIISVISMFFVAYLGDTRLSGIISSLILALVVSVGVLATFAATRLLSTTILKGKTEAFTLELPPYRKPQFKKVILRSLFDKTANVLSRAVAVAAPAGIVIWFIANTHIGSQTILAYMSDFFDPIGKLMGLDGIIITAFVLGFPANEIVVPIMLMAYTQEGMLSDVTAASAVKEILTSNGWTPTTAICFILFSLMHWPCSTTVLTVKKETGSIKWAIAAAVLPTAFGVLICIAVNYVLKLFT